MWQPDPGWERLPGGAGQCAGVWRASRAGHPVVVHRFVPPTLHDPAELHDQRHAAYWRRSAEVALSGLLEQTAGLRSARAVEVSEDADGITVVHQWVEPESTPGLFQAKALGVFAGGDLPDRPWWARDQLRGRLERVAHRGGWTTLARTTVADVADHLWRQRSSWLARLDALPQVPQHGDPTPANLIGRSGDDVLAIDWTMAGLGPAGGDLGYLSLMRPEELEPLVDAYHSGLGGLATRDEVLLGARITIVFTVLTRAEWALARVAGGEGALAGKYRHPAVAPHLRALQRQAPAIEALLDGG